MSTFVKFLRRAGNRPLSSMLAILFIASQFFVTGLMVTGKVFAAVSAPELASRSATGEQADRWAEGNPQISDDGRYMAYMSRATNLGGQRTDETANGIYVYDRLTQTTTLGSVGNDGIQEDGPNAGGFALSGDGRHLAFAVSAPNLDPTFPINSDYKRSVYVRDLDAGTTTVASLDNNGNRVYLRGSSTILTISYDGSVVAFIDNTINPGIAGLLNLYIRDLANSQMTIIPQQNIQGLKFSGDGAKLLYYPTVIVNNQIRDGSGRVYDRATGVTSNISFSSQAPNAGISWSDISHDGRYVLVSTRACDNEPIADCWFLSDMVNYTTIPLTAIWSLGHAVAISADGSKIAISSAEGSDNGPFEFPQAYVYDIATGDLQLVSRNAAGEAADGEVTNPDLSGNGSVVSFVTYALNFDAINEYSQLFFAEVTYDASPETTVSFAPAADTNVRGGQDNRNYGGNTFMRIQSSGNNRALVKFDQSEMESVIGSGTVLSATLRLAITDNANNWGATGRTVDIHRLLADWAEGNGTESDRGAGNGATWSCAVDANIQNQSKNCAGSMEWEMGQPNNPSVHPWAAVATATQTINNGQSGVIEYDVTADILAFLNGDSDNYGWLIKKTNENQNGQVSFGAKESAFSPELVITYQP